MGGMQGSLTPHSLPKEDKAAHLSPLCQDLFWFPKLRKPLQVLRQLPLSPAVLCWFGAWLAVGRGSLDSPNQEQKESSSTHSLSRRRTPCIQHEQVSVQDVPAVHLELDITQVGVVDHGTKILSQQPERGLGHRKNTNTGVRLQLSHTF